MSYLKLGIILIYLFIISDNLSSIFAQSIYELKTRSTNVRPKYMKNKKDFLFKQMTKAEQNINSMKLIKNNSTEYETSTILVV